MRPIVIAAGGTGGHFFPAEALAACLLQRGERVVLMTDARSSAAKSPVFSGCETHVLTGAGLAGRSIWRAAKGAALIARGVLAARRIMADMEPSVVVGFGGYPAVAPVLAARSLRQRPILILHDQNAALGKANKFLAKFCDRMALSFAATSGVPARRDCVLTGNPVRAAITALAGAPYVPPGEKINLLVLGGSLGARAFATLIPSALGHLPPALLGRISLTMQCPAASIETARAALLACGVTAVLEPFFADVAVGRPAVLIPLRINADQPANADTLAATGGAVRVEQSEGAEALAKVLESLLNDPARLAEMASAARRMGIIDAAARLADLVQNSIVAETVA